MIIVAISDTHGLHDNIAVPNGDLLIHCGDCTNDAGQASLRSFLKWFDSQPHRHKVFIAGNHDWAFQKWPSPAMAMVKELTSAHYLEDSGVNVDGISIWGSPYQPEFCNWAFNERRGPDIKRHWDMIPKGTDILVTHGPPKGILDISGFGNVSVGCSDLLSAIDRVSPKYHLFGHIHHSYGVRAGKTTFVNASICDEAYRPTRKPVIINYEHSSHQGS